MYRFIFKHLITRLDPEVAHHRAIGALSIFGQLPLVSRAAASTVFRTPSTAQREIFGKKIGGVVGLAAGLDKNAEAILGLDALGFGFIEIGTVTPEPQPGNEPPRLWRIVEQAAIRNRMGFNNIGAHAVAKNLRKLRETERGRDVVVGVNVGKNKWTSAEDAVDDYRQATRILAPYADYLVINVSSPNTPGLRDLQAVESLEAIADATREAAREVRSGGLPVLVKVAPDLLDDDAIEIAAMIERSDLAGVVATNTTIAHELGDGGLSGTPLGARAREVVRLFRDNLGAERTIIGVGGVSTPQDVRDMKEAGADLVQIYTSFIYRGPGLPSKLNRPF